MIKAKRNKLRVQGFRFPTLVGDMTVGRYIEYMREKAPQICQKITFTPDGREIAIEKDYATIYGQADSSLIMVDKAGYVYPIQADIFEKTYKIVEDNIYDFIAEKLPLEFKAFYKEDTKESKEEFKRLAEQDDRFRYQGDDLYVMTPEGEVRLDNDYYLIEGAVGEYYPLISKNFHRDYQVLDTI